MPPPLDRLAAGWVRAHGLAREAEREGRGDDALVEPFLPLLTARAPWRAQALDDARLFARCHLPIVLGLAVRVLPTSPSAPFEAWPRSLQPFAFELSGSVTMDGLERDTARMTIERVGFEDEEWRVIEVFDGRARARAELEARMLAELRARQRG